MNTQPCIHNMTFTVSLRLKVPVELSREVSKLSRFFFRSIAMDLFQLQMKRKYA